jgi:hypothetical protein
MPSRDRAVDGNISDASCTALLGWALKTVAADSSTGASAFAGKAAITAVRSSPTGRETEALGIQR